MSTSQKLDRTILKTLTGVFVVQTLVLLAGSFYPIDTFIKMSLYMALACLAIVYLGIKRQTSSLATNTISIIGFIQAFVFSSCHVIWWGEVMLILFAWEAISLSFPPDFDEKK